MKFSFRIFSAAFLMVLLSFGFGGFFIVQDMFTASLNSRKQAVCESNNNLCVSLQMITGNVDSDYARYITETLRRQLSGMDSGGKIYIGNASQLVILGDAEFCSDMQQGQTKLSFERQDGKYYLQIVSRIDLHGQDTYVENLADITDIYVRRQANCRLYQTLLLLVTSCSSGVLWVFSTYITRPLRRLTAAADAIAQGDFAKRTRSARIYRRTYETAVLAQSFDKMAENNQQYIEGLQRFASQQEDFVANFTHELKTPLTSIIGYADMLRSFDLPSTQRRESAEYIYKEGKRLESLSLHLLDFFVLEKSQIQAVRIHTDSFIAQVKNTVAFLLQKYDVTLKCQCVSAEIFADPVLLKTLLYNLIDNACKASNAGGVIILAGKPGRDRYTLALRDYGKGIAQEDLKKITEPFYMVDKSRARSQGGAGLGLALCKEIARQHGSTLQFKSEVGRGTIVSFSVSLFQDTAGKESVPQQGE